MSVIILKRGQPLPISPAQRYFGTLLGQDRELRAVANGLKQTTVRGPNCELTSEEQNIGSAICELVLADALYGQLDMRQGPDEYDVRLFDATTIDAKWNPFDVDLLVGASKGSKRCDLYIPMLGNVLKQDTVLFGGWATAATVFAQPIMQTSRGRVHMVKAAFLIPKLTIPIPQKRDWVREEASVRRTLQR